MKHKSILLKYKKILIWHLEGPGGYGNKIYQSGIIKTHIRRLWKKLKRYFTGPQGYGKRIYRRNIPGIVSSGLPVLLAIILTVPVLFKAKPQPDKGLFEYMVCQLNRYSVYENIYVASIKQPDHAYRKEERRGIHPAEHRGTSQTTANNKPTNRSYNQTDSKRIYRDYQRGIRQKSVRAASAIDQLNIADKRARWRAYNKQHINDPNRGYNMTPQTVSMTYELQKADARDQDRIEERIMEEHEKAWPPDIGQQPQIVISIESYSKNQLLIIPAKGNKIPQITLNGKKKN